MLAHVQNFISALTVWCRVVVHVFLSTEMAKKVSDYCHILNRDIRYVVKAVKGIRRGKYYIKNNLTLVDELEKNAEKIPDKVCFIFEDKEFTFQEVSDYSNRICNTIGSRFDKGDVVVVMLPNSPEYCCIWLGLLKAGIISALVNTNVRMKPLLHCINSTKPKAIIYSTQFDSALSEILEEIEGNPVLYSLEKGSTIANSQNLPDLLNSADLSTIKRRPTNTTETVIYIFTSGTTGFPKPAKINNTKLLALVIVAEFAMDLRHEDIVYSPMPLYHTAGTTAACCALVTGCTAVLRNKFSASAYISDCRKYNATVALHIGEMLRYVTNTKEQPGERDHKLRIVAGNGLRGEVWKKFVDRFRVGNVTEYYGSTEGNFLLVNVNMVGCCGYLPISIPYYYLTGPSLIKMDSETGEPIRGKNGFCIRAKPGEPGLCIGYCPAGNELRKFNGYINEKDSDSKRIRNVYKQGDLAFNTGDVMVMDERGWLTFVDRLGDTFRWKGENVSTAEVEDILNTYPGVVQCAVYGVQVGSLEGKAGMASIEFDSKPASFDDLARFLSISLPPYAEPLFIRVAESLQITGTFKVVKTELKKQGFDINIVKDPIYIRFNNTYLSLDEEMYNKVLNDEIKL